MSLKDLFGNTTNQVVINKSLQELNSETQTDNFVEALTVDNNRYLPNIDFSNPANFARYGSAEKYYVDGIKNIYQFYPYDGSKKEKLEWRNNASQIDLYIFDNIYPKSVGYINLNVSSSLYTSGIYRSSSLPQYVTIKGGPNPSSNKVFSLSNIYDPSINRESNLSINNLGNTVEFWFKDETSTLNANYNSSYALFDLWNGISASANNYSRLSILKVNGQNKFSITYRSGSSGVTEELIDYTFDSSIWHQYAFVLKPVNNIDLQIELYVDGELVKQQYYNNAALSLANNNNAIAFLGALRCDPTTTDENKAGLGVCYGSFDDFRFWKIARNSQQIYRNWFTNVDGGSNTDDTNVDLGVYLKFNEGTIDTTKINDLDKKCIDYSGRISNGDINNYCLGVKVENSAIDEYYGEEKEKRDIIIFSSNPLVQNIINTYGDIGFAYDQQNVSSIYKSIPAWITEENDKLGLEDLPNLIQIISSYFDTLHIQIENINKVKNIEYVSNNEKPKPFSKYLLTSNGLEMSELFSDSTFLEKILSRNEKEDFEKNINDIKNIIYQNIYNNLSYIYKSKGTEKSLRNLIRCFGVDDELIKINLYSDNSVYEIKDKYTYSTNYKKFVDFNDPDRYDGFVYQKRKNDDLTNTTSFIHSDAGGLLDFVPITVQAEVIFPKQLPIESDGYKNIDFLSSSIFGMHTANGIEDDFSWDNDEFNFQVYSVREEINSPNVSFLVTGSFSGSQFSLNTSVIKEVYNNEKWNLAVRIKPIKHDHANLAEGSDNTNYVVEFVGFNSIADAVNNSFSLSAEIDQNNMRSALRKHKRLYVGSHYEDFDNSKLLCKTDLKISSVRFWYDYLLDEELLSHSYESINFGRLHPTWKPEHLLVSELQNINFTKANTLALNWDFSNVTKTDINGQFVVDDLTSGSQAFVDSSAYGTFTQLVGYQHSGFGDEFYQNDDQVVNKEYLLSAKKQNPEILNGNDLVQVLDTDDVTRTKDSKAITYYLSIEKSMSQVINDEILKWFATIKGFNNLIGESADRYRAEYSGIRQMREIFFQKVGNSLNFEKFFEFYKWIDSSLSLAVEQLIPLSTNASTKIKNIVESHMLERNKYENKLPTIEFKGEPKSYPVVSHVGYNYEEQAAYPNNLQEEIKISRYYSKKPLWLKQRVARDESLVNSVLEPKNDIDREIVRQVINYNNIDKLPILFSDSQPYDGKEDNIRLFTKTYKIFGDSLYSLEDRIDIGNISNARIQSQFIFASSSVTGSEQIIQPKAKKPNYLNNYEFLQTSGRTANNKSFVELTGAIFAASGTNILGFTDRELPNRQVNKNIFVERFSAPGGPEISSRGTLDKDAEEYSAYNSLNYRNYRVRNNLNKWLSETSSIDSNNPSYHKVADNIARYPGDDNNSYINVQNDNWFINHAIPRSDYQYSWITSSMMTGALFSGYSSEFTNLNIDYQFLSGNISGSQIVDYLGLNTTIVKTVDTSSNTISPENNLTDINKYLSNTNGPYQHPSWKQIRGGETLISRISRKNNKVLVQDTPQLKTKIENGVLKPYVDFKSQTFKSYKEMPVSFNKPMKHVVDIENSDSLVEIVSTYDNNKEMFSNELLGNAVGVDSKQTPQLHDVIKNLEEGLFEPKPEIVEVSYDNMAYPNNTYVGSADVRLRSNYEDWYGNTGSIVNARTYWRDSIDERARASITKDIYEFDNTTFNALPEEQSFIIYNDEYNNFNTLSNINNFKQSILAQDAISDITSFTQSANYLTDPLIRRILFINNLNEISTMNSSFGNSVTSLFSGSNRVYAGGFFSGSGVSQWDGTNWSPMGGGLNGSIYTIISGSNRVYAGGGFSSNVSGSRVSQWDGINWSPMDSSLPAGTVYALASGSNRVYAGGSFNSIDSGSKVSQWDGSSWSPMGGGLQNEVRALVSGSNRVYAGGGFSSVVSGTGVSQWDGISWSPMGGGLPVVAPFRQVFCILSGSDRVYAGGVFISTISGSNISQWDGSSWSPMGAGVNGAVFSLLSNSSGLYAVGSFTLADNKAVSNIARWDGTEWYNVSFGFGGPVRTIIADENSNFYAGGDFLSLNNIEIAYVSKIIEDGIYPVGNTLSRASLTLTSGSDGIYSGGSSTIYNINGSIHKWDGENWSIVGLGLGGSNGSVQSVISGSNRVYAGGLFSDAGIGSNVSQWDGISWSPMGGGLPSTVYALVSGSNRVYAGGSFNSIDSGSRVSQWDGTSWSPMGDGLSGQVNILVSGSNRVYAGGSFYSVDSGSYISQWDGTSWSPVFSLTPNSSVYSIITASDGIYFGGDFTKIGSSIYRRIAKWDGVSITNLGNGLNSSVTSLFSNSSGLYAGGSFTFAGNKAASKIARWDGAEWHEISVGFTNTVKTIISGSDALYVGGLFKSAGQLNNTNVSYRFYNKGNITKNNLIENSFFTKNNIFYPLDALATYDVKQKNLYNINSNLEPIQIIDFIGEDILSIASGSDGLYAGGTFTTLQGNECLYIAKRFENDWQSLGGGLSGRVNCIASGSNRVYAGGYFSSVDSGSYVSQWDGTSWSPMGSELFDDVLSIISGSDYVYAGSFITTDGACCFNKWDGISWTPVGGEVLNLGTGIVYAIASGSNVIYVGGAHAFGSIAQWNGTMWSSVGDDLPGYIFAIASGSSRVYAGGSFSSVTSGSYISQWDGTSWSPMGGGLNGVVRTIFSNSSGVYVGGDFTSGSNSGVSIILNRIAKWNGTSWEQINDTGDRNGFNLVANQTVHTIIGNDDKLTIAGTFTGTRSGPIIKPYNFNNFVEGYEKDALLYPNPQLVHNNFIPPSSGSEEGMKIAEVTYNNSNIISSINNYSSYERINIINDGYEYEIDEKSGKTPFFNSYLDYLGDLKARTAKYSIIPEYTISDFIKTYVKEKNGNFNSILNEDYLKLDGAAQESGYEDINNSINITNLLKPDLIFDNAKSNENINLNFKISGIKKLMPYRDFYPSERVIKLSNYFINSFLDLDTSLTSVFNPQEVYSSSLSNGTPINQQILTLLQPLMAPGILLNTIKSSIAVDWPAFICDSGSYTTNNLGFYSNTGSNLITKQVYDVNNSIYHNYTASNYINQEANFRFPFESLIEFDTLVPQELRTDDNNLYYLNPTYYTSDVITGSDYYSLAYPSYNMGADSIKTFTFRDNNYKLAMHNFLAEIPNFFLGQKLSNIVSLPENKFKSAKAGVTYYMDVVLERDSRYKEFIADPYYEGLKAQDNSFSDGTFLLPSPDSLYGPPTRYWNNTNPNAFFARSPYNFYSKLLDTPAYAPYVPPYYYGKAIARISFTATDDRQYSLAEIQNSCSIEYINTEAENLFNKRSNYINGNFDGPFVDNYSSTPAYKQMMKISSSVNLLLASEDKSFTTDPKTGEVVEVRDRETNNQTWVIQTKFETPSINFADSQLSENIGLKFLGGTKENGSVKGVYSYMMKGLWTTYGQPVKDGSGIKLYIQESFKEQEDAIGSLIDLCGFTNTKDQKKTIGLLAERKKVNEGIVIIPYTYNKNHGNNKNDIYAETLPEILGENGIYSVSQTGNGPYYYKIDKKIISRYLGGLNFDNSSFEQIKKAAESSEYQDNSIIKLINSMTKYVIPPHLDWLRNKNITPFVMYIADFSTEFDKQDLSDIWQGVMPKQSYRAELDEVSINHKFEVDEMFHSKRPQSDTKFKVFKVKQRANINYYKLTDDSKDDERFKFTFGNSQQATIPEYSYNWPYDFFSLVELVNIETSLSYEKPEEKIQEIPINRLTDVITEPVPQVRERKVKELSDLNKSLSGRRKPKR